MEQFILRYTWFALNTILKYCGLDLLRRDGDTGLKPSSACRFWTRLVCTYVVLFSGTIGTVCYILNFETTYENFVRALNEKVYTSAITTFAMQSQGFWALGINFIGISKLRFLSKRLVGIQDYYNHYALKDKHVTKKFLWKTLPFFVLIFIGWSLAQISFGAFILPDMKVSSFWAGLWIMWFILLLLISLTPIWYFVLIYIEVSLFQSPLRVHFSPPYF